jgi:hypothetical protein
LLVVPEIRSMQCFFFFFAALQIESRAFLMLVNHSATELHPSLFALL